MAGQESLTKKMLALVTVCSAQAGRNGYRLSWELKLQNPRARACGNGAQSGLTAAVALAAVTNGGWWLLWSRQRLGSAVVSYGSCKGKDSQGYGGAETEVQAETLTAALVTQSCRALALAVVVTAAAEAKKLRATQRFARGGRM